MNLPALVFLAATSAIYADALPPNLPAAAPAFVPGHFGEVLNAAAGGLTLPCPDGSISLPFTVECWVRLTGAKDANAIVAGGPKGSSARWELRSHPGDGRLELLFPETGEELISSAAIGDGHWHYLAMALDSSRMRLWVDGGVVEDAPQAPPLTGQAIVSEIAIGQTLGGAGRCNGCIEEVRLSRGTRDIREVPQVPFTVDAATVALWPLDGSVAAFSRPGEPVLPEFKTIPAATRGELTPANGWPSLGSFSQWTRSQGGPTSNRYVTFTQIDKTNVGHLAEAWTYRSGDGKANIQCNPIFVDGLLYVATPGLALAALDGETGREVWRYRPEKQGNGLEDVPARRGLLY